MIWAAILLGLCQIVSIGAACFLFRWYVDRKQAEIEARLDAEFNLLVKGEPCQSASLLLAVGRAVGAEAGRSAKAALMSDLSHLSRASNAQSQEEQLALASETSPAIGTVLAGMGKRGAGKMLQNPIVQLALAALSGGGLRGNGHNGGTPASHGSVRDRLGKGV